MRLRGQSVGGDDGKQIYRSVGGFHIGKWFNTHESGDGREYITEH